MLANKKSGVGGKEGGQPLVAVAVARGKGSQNALKYATDNLLQDGQTVILLHVVLPHGAKINQISDAGCDGELECKDTEIHTKDLLLPFRCFCTRRDIKCKEVVLHDTDVSKALIEYIDKAAIEILVIGSSKKSGFLRKFKNVDIPAVLLKGAADFCTIYTISKGRIYHFQAAKRPAPGKSSLRNQILSPETVTNSDSAGTRPPKATNKRGTEKQPFETPKRSCNADLFRSPFTRKGNGRSCGELSLPDSDISYVSSRKASIDSIFPGYDSLEAGHAPWLSEKENNRTVESIQYRHKSMDISTPLEFSLVSEESDGHSTTSHGMDDVEAEMRRLKLELKQTMEMYSTACKEAFTAKEKTKQLQQWKLEEEQIFEEVRLGEETAKASIEREKAKSKAAIDAAEAAQRIAELEVQKRIHAEMKAVKEAKEKQKVLDSLARSETRYRKYSIEEIEAGTDTFAKSQKLGEGGYGPVYKGYLDHTPVAIKVLRPDAAQGRSQFQQEVEILSCIRHPNMVLLLGACPEYGCLVYEFMANGSLEDCLLRRGNQPPLSWQLRFKIAAEIGSGLLFLHQAKPEPFVHRDLKPANILLDNNYVSKIGDVGLARLVPPSVADSVTQYHMTSAAGTFCYIDPEYQQTGMLGVKSDIYSLGIMYLQLLTAKPPMGLTHHVSRAVANGTFAEMLDPSVQDWPVEEALCFAKLALKCAELRRKDRPDLGKVVMPELNRLRTLAEEAKNV